jgi:hypothetical protein
MVWLTNVGSNPTRSKFFYILRADSSQKGESAQKKTRGINLQPTTLRRLNGLMDASDFQNRVARMGEGAVLRVAGYGAKHIA